MSNIKELRKTFKFHDFGTIYCASALTKCGCQDAFRKKFANNSKIVFKKFMHVLAVQSKPPNYNLNPTY